MLVFDHFLDKMDADHATANWASQCLETLWFNLVYAAPKASSYQPARAAELIQSLKATET